MDNNMALLYFIMLLISTCLFFYILTKTNFDKIFKKGRISEIRISYFLVSFMLGTINAFGIVKLVETILELILN